MCKGLEAQDGGVGGGCKWNMGGQLCGSRAWHVTGKRRVSALLRFPRGTKPWKLSEIWWNCQEYMQQPRPLGHRSHSSVCSATARKLTTFSWRRAIERETGGALVQLCSRRCSQPTRVPPSGLDPSGRRAGPALRPRPSARPPRSAAGGVLGHCGRLKALSKKKSRSLPEISGWGHLPDGPVLRFLLPGLSATTASVNPAELLGVVRAAVGPGRRHSAPRTAARPGLVGK